MKISIIVPVYNTKKYLSECLDSLIAQTYSDIEILCVDDCSTDGSIEIIKSYAEKDSRIVPIFLSENHGTSYARKMAGMRCSGDYVMFCDSDDKYLPNACEVVAKELAANPVDILHFRSRVSYHRTFDKQRQQNICSFIEPYLGEVDGDLLKACYIDKKWNFTLWNKAYNAEACRKAFTLASEKNFSVGTDVYAFFLISYYCQSYRGIPIELNEYRYGTGLTGFQAMTKKQFYKTCDKLTAVNELTDFLKKVEAEDRYYKYAHQIREEMLNGIVYSWFNTVSIEDAADCFWYLAKKQSPSELMGILARRYWRESAEIVKRIAVRRNKHEVGKKVARIAVYYNSICNGGAQKVAAQMVQMLADRGFYVLLVTDTPASDDDYPIPENIERVILPHFEDASGENYHLRAYTWEYLIKSYQIDTIVYHQGLHPALLWDFCTIKAFNVNLIAQLHSVFNSTMWYSLEMSSYCPYIYQLADRLVCLSRMDQIYWENFGIAAYIPNPVELCSREQMSNLSSSNIVWVGRISAEKQLDKMLEAFSIVQASVPEATLTVVGDGADSQFLKNAQAYAQKLEIENAVIFAGFQLNVSEYYQNASVLAMTSKIEGYSLVLAESKAYGLPAVMFDLPWIEFCRDGRGIVCVPQGSTIRLAEELIALLRDPEKRAAQGKLARESIEDFAAFDYAGSWQQVFDSFMQPQERKSNIDHEMILDCIFSGIQQGVQRLGGGTEGRKSDGLRAAVSRHEEVVNRHEEVVNRHEEVVNRHEEVINRHESSINHQWEIQKWHEERLVALENRKSLSRRILSKIKRVVKRILHYA